MIRSLDSRRAARLFAAAALMLAPLLACAFDLQGHRGARGLAPENTLPAFAAALSLGVSTLELDTSITKDGVVVVSHDARLNPDITRGPDGRWLNPPTRAVRELTLDDLGHYDVGRIKPGSEYSSLRSIIGNERGYFRHVVSFSYVLSSDRILYL